ncbi:Arc family DNA-binding protein [Phaeobacter gallaeciensis]|uniref:Arc family DNA-binding protein n=1 Tax=Phaeobacter gallaeciensis TaxID=60890 RepID=UPI0003F54A92
MKKYPSQLADCINIRLPNGWRDAIKARAAQNRRSMNSEVLAALESVVGEAAGGDLGGTAPAAEDNSTALARG